MDVEGILGINIGTSIIARTIIHIDLEESKCIHF